MRSTLLVLILGLASPALAQEEAPPPAAQALASRALRHLAEEDSVFAVEFLTGQEDALAATEAFSTAMKELYWQQKDVVFAVAFARAGVQHGLVSARQVESSDAERAYALRSVAKGLCYDIAAFTWPGWDDEGIVVTATDLRLGLDAARANLRLARELDKGDLPLSRAHWVLGAQRLARGQHAKAQESFATAARFAQTAGSRADVLLNQGYSALVDVLHSPQERVLHQRLESIQEQLRPLEHGAFYVQQLDTALGVFSR